MGGGGVKYGCGLYLQPAGVRCPVRASEKDKFMANYTDKHAEAGIDAKLPALETWPNQFPG